MFAEDEPPRPETRETMIRAVPIPLDLTRDPDTRTTVERPVPSRDAMLALYL
jgi:hypothetical protein